MSANQILYSFLNSKIYFHHTVTENPDPQDFLSHTHNQYEAYCFLNGNAEFVVEGILYPLSPGTLILTSPGQTHHLIVKGKEPVYERMALLFSEPVMPESFKTIFSHTQKETHLFQLSEQEISWIHETVHIIKSAGDHPEVEFQLLRAMMMFMVTLLTSSKGETIKSRGSVDELVQQIILYVNEHLTEQISLERIEKHFFVNRNYLNREFKEVMGCGIWEYILKKRVFLAQKCLYDTQDISSAYEASGFNDYSTFYRRYRKYVGKSPKEDLLGMK